VRCWAALAGNMPPRGRQRRLDPASPARWAKLAFLSRRTDLRPELLVAGRLAL
jgi:hypothetical protein